MVIDSEVAAGQSDAIGRSNFLIPRLTLRSVVRTTRAAERVDKLYGSNRGLIVFRCCTQYLPTTLLVANCSAYSPNLGYVQLLRLLRTSFGHLSVNLTDPACP